MANNIGKKQIATYENKVVEIVPEYKQKGAPKETITITKTSVIQETYAPYSNNEQTEGMYILAHTINDSNYRTGDWNEYEPHQLVAKDDLNYRFLLPTGEDSTSPTYNALLALCVNSSNTNRTISRDEGHNTYETTLTPKTGYSKVPAGRVEKQKGNDTWESVYSWNTPLDSVTIRILDVDGNLRFVFNSNCIYELTVYTTIDGVIQPNPLVIEGICETPINVDNYAQSISGKTFVNITENGTPISGEQDFCENTSIYVNYTTNEYTVTNEIDPNCATVEISNPTPEYGDTVIIRITKTSDKANIGAGSISMVGADNPIYSWNKIVGPIEYTIDSVIGSITIDAECGDPAIRKVTIQWVNEQGTLMHQEINDVETGSTILPEDYVDDWPLTEGYYIKDMNPAEGTLIIVDSDKTIIYNCKLYQYTVNFVAGNGITITGPSSAIVTYNEGTNSTYTISSEYRNAVEAHTGTANVSLNNGSVVVSNVKSNVTVTISATQIPSYNVSFAFDDPNAGTVTPSTVQVLEGGCAEVGYTLNNYYTIDSITKEGSGDDPTLDPQTNTIEVCNVTGNVNVTINTNYNPPVETHRVTYTLSGGGIHLYKDGEIIQSDTTFEDVEDGNCSEMGYVLVEGYQFDEAASSVPSIVPTVDTTNRIVEVCPTSDVTITLSTWRPTITYDIYEDGVKIDTLTQIVGVGGTAILQYRKSNTEDYVNPPTISSNDPNLTVNVVKNINRGYTITGTPVTQDATISLYLVTKSQYTVTFEVYKDGILDRSAGWTSNYTEGETFDDETFTYDDSLYEINDVISQELTVDYNYGDPGEIVISTETPITENATVEITLIAKRLLDSINLSASEMDAMGGVIFTATKNYSDGTSETDDTQSNFSVSYTDWKGNLNVTDQDIVDVYDHVDREVQTKSKLNYENPTISRKTGIPVTVTYNDGVNTKQDTLQINLRAEVYGYYSGITTESSTSELDSTKWTTSELLDFGDGVQMFNGSGNDIYNKDITPYQIPGTYIGENPLNHLDSNVSFVNSSGIVVSSPASHDYNSINSRGHGEHYHIAWNNGGRNGYLFDYDGMSMGDSFCGGHIGTCTGCHETGYADSSRATLEAFSPPSKNGISRTPTIEYGIYYVSPQHRYGADSISYYHYKNKEYKSSIVNSPFKDTNYETIEFKYPVHIQLLLDTDYEEFKSWPTATSYGAGPTSYGMRTTRWSIDGNIESYPDSDVYITYSDGSGYYYDFENKITLHGDNSVNFAPYNNAYYVESEQSPNNKEDAANNLNGGRYVGIYNSLMSAETLIRPYYEDSQWKYVVLNAAYNGINYNNFLAASRLKEVDMREYAQRIGIRTRYISGYALNDLGIVPSGMTVPSTYEPIKENGVELVEYPYYVDMNTDYSRYVDNNDSYQDATAYDSSLNHAHCLFNVSDYVNYNQYRNSPECAEHYLSNSDDAKYTICSTKFDTLRFRRYEPSTYTLDNFNWADIFKDIASITENLDHRGYYDITLNNGTVYSACRRYSSYNDCLYYYSQEIEVGTFWTNGDFVDILAISCGGGKIGSFRVVVYDAVSGSVIDELTKDCSWEGTANTLSLGRDYAVKDLQVTIYANTNRVGQANDLSDPNYTSNVYTGGCSFQIVSQWSNGPSTPYQQFMWTYIGGSCDKTNNPDKSGADISWEDMYEYYQYSDGTPFDNTKYLDLIPKKDPDFNS